MAKIYSLQLNHPDDIILVDCLLLNHLSQLVFDTGASNTIIDYTTLLIAGIAVELKNLPTKEFETANGIITTFEIEIPKLKIFQTTFLNLKIYTVDFFEKGIGSNYEGVIGLDLMKHFDIHLNFKQQQLVVQ